MSEIISALLAKVPETPAGDQYLQWMVIADAYDDEGQPESAELVRLRTQLIYHPEEITVPIQQIEERIYSLIRLHQGRLKKKIPALRKELVYEIYQSQRSRRRVAKINLVWIPPCTYRMGELGKINDEDKFVIDESKGVEVQLTKGFWMSETPITEHQWASLMGQPPSNYGKNNPVVSVSWSHAMEFCQRLSTGCDSQVTLPTSAQWECAARGGFRSPTYGPLDDISWNNISTGSSSIPRYTISTKPVGKKVPNSWGLHDVLGNIWEWCRNRPYLNLALSSPQLINPGDEYSPALPLTQREATERESSRHSDLGKMVASSFPPYSEVSGSFQVGIIPSRDTAPPRCGRDLKGGSSSPSFSKKIIYWNRLMNPNTFPYIGYGFRIIILP